MNHVTLGVGGPSAEHAIAKFLCSKTVVVAFGSDVNEGVSRNTQNNFISNYDNFVIIEEYT